MDRNPHDSERGVSAALLGVAALAILTIAPEAARAGTLYSTNFAAPQFTAGRSVNGQGGFSVSPSPDTGAFTIGTTNPYYGTQALEANGSQLPYVSANGLYQATAAVTLNYDASTGPPIVTLEAHAMLDGPNTNTGNGTSDDLVSINLEARLSDGSYFSTYLSSDGQAYAFTNNYDFNTPVALGVYHDLEVILNFANQTASFIVYGQTMGTLALGSSSTVLQSAAISFYAYPPPYVNPSDYSGAVGNLLVTASVPEPSSLILAAIGGVMISTGIAVRRTRSRPISLASPQDERG